MQQSNSSCSTWPAVQKQVGSVSKINRCELVWTGSILPLLLAAALTHVQFFLFFIFPLLPFSFTNHTQCVFGVIVKEMCRVTQSRGECFMVLHQSIKSIKFYKYLFFSSMSILWQTLIILKQTSATFKQQNRASIYKVTTADSELLAAVGKINNKPNTASWPITHVLKSGASDSK